MSPKMQLKLYSLTPNMTLKSIVIGKYNKYEFSKLNK